MSSSSLLLGALWLRVLSYHTEHILSLDHRRLVVGGQGGFLDLETGRGEVEC